MLSASGWDGVVLPFAGGEVLQTGARQVRSWSEPPPRRV